MLRRIYFSVALLIAIVGSALAQNAPVKGQQLFSGTFICDSVNHRYKWTVPSSYPPGYPLVVVKAQIWFGLDHNSWSDFTGSLWRWSDGSYMADGGHDDYTNGGMTRIHTQDWGGNFYTFVTGDQIIFDTSCSPGETPGHHGAIAVTVWYRQ